MYILADIRIHLFTTWGPLERRQSGESRVFRTPYFVKVTYMSVPKDTQPSSTPGIGMNDRPVMKGGFSEPSGRFVF